jgi:hypothetical protein
VPSDIGVYHKLYDTVTSYMDVSMSLNAKYPGIANSVVPRPGSSVKRTRGELLSYAAEIAETSDDPAKVRAARIAFWKEYRNAHEAIYREATANKVPTDWLRDIPFQSWSLDQKIQKIKSDAAKKEKAKTQSTSKMDTIDD